MGSNPLSTAMHLSSLKTSTSPGLATSLGWRMFAKSRTYRGTGHHFRRRSGPSPTSREPTTPDAADSLNNLAVLYDNQSRYADAEPLYR